MTRRETSRFGDNDMSIPNSNNPSPVAAPYIDEHPQYITSPGAVPAVDHYLLPPPTPQTPIRQASLIRRPAFDESSAASVPYAPRFVIRELLLIS